MVALVVLQLGYFHLVAGEFGGTSVIGVLVTAALSYAGMCFMIMETHADGVQDAEGSPYKVVGIVSAVGAAEIALAQILFLH
ncbi:hypothetical protein [Nonomuraea solani]|uniref:hypothetical protein n=1 Tax=Nonomuraea solani TaxID=1144553 RepID=UPI0011AFF7BE|nr:hypothetical protein [Nonomuraea solani]